MGDVTEMILEGMLCQVCGVYMGDGDGYPVTCGSCKPKKRKKKKAAAPKPEGQSADAPRAWRPGADVDPEALS